MNRILKENGKLIKEQTEILHDIMTFYEQFYTAKNTAILV